MKTRRLSEVEFSATFVEPMRSITALAVKQSDADDEPGPEGGVLDIWPYVAAVPRAHLGSHTLRPGEVESVIRSADAHWDHVLVATDTKNVYLVVVVDVASDRVHGHLLLDLNEKYGVKPEPEDA